MPTSRFLTSLAAALAAALSLSAQADVYVSQVPQDGSAPSILVFASGAIGDTPPIRVIEGPNTGLVAPFAIAVDPVNAELYVSDFFGSAVRVYPLGADGDVAPLRTLVDGPNSHLKWPRQLVVDTVNDEIVVPSFNLDDPPPAPFSSLRVYPRTADGDVAPLRSIYGDATTLNNPINIVLDTTHGELVTNSYEAGGAGAGLLAFSRTADGDAAPLRFVAGPSTPFASSGYTNFLAYDPGAGELYADAYPGGEPGYVVYARTASGDVPPSRAVSGIETGIRYLYGMAYDVANDRVIVVNYDEHGGPPPSLNVFASSADGDVVPVLTVSGPHTRLVAPSGIAVDGAGGFGGTGAAIYQRADDFDAALGGSPGFTLEDFEGGAAVPGQVVICDDPLDAASDDRCFTPGQLVPGFRVRSSSGAGVGAVGSGFFGNASTAVGQVFLGDATIVELERGSTRVSMDLFLYNATSEDWIDVAVYDADGRSLGSASVQPGAGGTLLADAMQGFVGVIAPAPISRIELTASRGGAFIDNLRFDAGDAIFADGFD